MTLVAPIIDEPVQSKPCRPTTRKVLLLGNDDRVLLAVARGLGREGISVHVGWCDSQSPALSSKYVVDHHDIPAFDPNDDCWLRSLNHLAQQQQFDLVIPCNDFAVIPLQAAKDSLSKDCRWYLISDTAFEIAFDKSNTSRLANSLGISVPREFEFDRDQALQIASGPEVTKIGDRTLRFPVYVKPLSSITQSDVTNKRSVDRATTAGELAESLRNNCSQDGILVQEGFSGDGVGVEVLACEGRVLMQLQHRRLRETIDGGSTYRESIAELSELTDATRKMIHELDYTGVAMFEFRYCEQTETWVFLEINARFWGSLPLAIASGMNFPFGLYQLLVNDHQESSHSYTVGTRCRNFVKDLRAHRQQPDSQFYWSRILTGKDHLDFFAADDWRPQVVSLMQWGQSLLAKVFLR